MSKKHFGTDGVRGTVGKDPMTADFAIRLASAVAQVLVPTGGSVLIGKDTRLSGYMFESALEAGFTAAGADVLLVGPLPTPGVAHLTQEFSADLGVVISASHNLYFDNGIKFFDGAGSKLTDKVERAIEANLDKAAITVDSQSLGRAQRIDSALVRYEKFCAGTLPDGLDLAGLKVVFDGANGAGYKVGPRTLANLDAEVIPIGCSPNGRNINDGCGSTRPELLQLTVPAVAADVGIALDGDGDRVVLVDETGRLVDGDQILYVLATAWQEEGRLNGPVVGTVMSNLGLERALQARNIEFQRAAVGDRYVLEALKQGGGIIGGETSGHMIVLDQTTTGDGLITALQVLAVMKQTGRKLSELVAGMPKYPQTMLNVRTEQRLDPDASPQIRQALNAARDELAEDGRVVLRASGTEPVIRVMVEGRDEAQITSVAERLAAVVADAAREEVPQTAQKA
jgi:phosphoglucosamine mutase